MRRKDREVTENSEIEEILNKCKVFRIGLVDDSGVYILPLNFGYVLDGNKLELYFHGAKAGKKVELLDRDATVGFEMDCEHKLVKGDDPCEYSYKYASIIGQGKATIVLDALEKAKTLNYLMKHQTGNTFEFSRKTLESVSVYKIIADKFTAKRHK